MRVSFLQIVVVILFGFILFGSFPKKVEELFYNFHEFVKKWQSKNNEPK